MGRMPISIKHHARPKLKRAKSAPVVYFPEEHFKEAVWLGAEEFIVREFGDQLSGHPKAIVESLVATTVIYAKDSHDRHLQAIARAYALYVYDEQHGREISSALEQELPRTRKTHKNYESSRFFLEILVSYDGGKSREPSTRANWFYARDARAIRYLMSKGVGPDKLIELAAQRGEGLDRWARAASAKADTGEGEKEAESHKAEPSVQGKGYRIEIWKDDKTILKENIPEGGAEFIEGVLSTVQAFVKLPAKAGDSSPRKRESFLAAMKDVDARRGIGPRRIVRVPRTQIRKKFDFGQ